MKLRNKKTGKVIEWFNNTDGVFPNTLAELNEEWEDYEEPETYYYISDCINIESLTNDHGYNLPEEIWKKGIERRKEVGNHFETREEAEEAVEKLKAWQRLKDKGFRFNGRTYETDKRFGSVFYEVDKDSYSEDIIDDLDLLFGGEDE